MFRKCKFYTFIAGEIGEKERQQEHYREVVGLTYLFVISVAGEDIFIFQM